MALRDNPYGQFNFMVKLGDAGGEDQIAGGFSDAGRRQCEKTAIDVLRAAVRHRRGLVTDRKVAQQRLHAGPPPRRTPKPAARRRPISLPTRRPNPS